MKLRVTRMHVLPAGNPIFSEPGYSVEIDDEAGGEFLILKDNDDNAISFDKEHWPTIKSAVEAMIKESDEWEALEQ
jgi:hypothetical protein